MTEIHVRLLKVHPSKSAYILVIARLIVLSLLYSTPQVDEATGDSNLQ